MSGNGRSRIHVARTPIKKLSGVKKVKWILEYSASQDIHRYRNRERIEKKAQSARAPGGRILASGTNDPAFRELPSPATIHVELICCPYEEKEK